MRSTIPVVAGIVALMVVGLAWGAGPAVYKCTDVNGHVTFTQTPPSGANCTALGGASSNAPPPAKQPQAKRPPANQPKSATKPGGGSAASTGDTSVRRKNCALAKHNLAILKSSKPVVETEANGKQVTLSKKQRAQALSQTHKDIDYWCK